MIFFRADGNSKIGTGHIMRCLSIADALKRNEEESVFIIADDSMQKLISDRGYKTHILSADFKKMADNIEQTIALINNCDARCLIVDSYYVTAEYLSQLKEHIKLVYIDDLAAFAYPVDVLINYNIYADTIDYKRLYTEQGVALPQLLIGTDYVPLRSMFSDITPRPIRETVKDVLISTGGSDPIHLAVDLIRALRTDDKMDKITFHFLIGAMNPDRNEIEQLAGKMDNVVLHCNVSDMKSLICSCDIAVSAAGSTLYEICACGVPLITYVLADNQIKGAKAFEKKAVAFNCGDIRILKDKAKCIFETIYLLINDRVMRSNMHRNCINAINSCGAEKIVNEIEEF